MTLPGELDAVGVVQATAVQVEVTPPDVREPPPTPDGPPADPIIIAGDTRLVLDLDALPAVMKSPDGTGLRMSAAVAVLWQIQHSMQIRAVTGRVVLTAVPGGVGGSIWQAGRAIDFPLTWDTVAPIAPSTGVLITTEAGVIGAGKTTAVVKDGTVTTTGAAITATNVSGADLIVNGSAPIIYHAQGLYLYSPVLDLEQ